MITDTVSGGQSSADKFENLKKGGRSLIIQYPMVFFPYHSIQIDNSLHSLIRSVDLALKNIYAFCIHPL